MSITDPIANMLTRIRNAGAAGKDKVDVRASKINEGILNILKEEQFIQNHKPISDKKQGIIRVYLKFDEEGDPGIRGLKRISRPGLRVYANKKEIPKVLGGLGIAIVSTPQGLMADEVARQKGLGGEVLCHIW